MAQSKTNPRRRPQARPQFPMVTRNGEAPIYAIGDLFVCAVSPDFERNAGLQRGNRARPRKLLPKKSWELGDNRIGATPPRLPRSAQMEFQPYLWINLIDGNPNTCWCSRGQIKPDVEPVWIRLDLPKEVTLTAVVLVPGKHPTTPGADAGLGLPKRLSIRLSTDAWHWETVYHTESLQPPSPPGQPLRFSFKPRRAKQIWIIGEHFPALLNFGHCFYLPEVEAYDDSGTNVALASRGTGITVSSTNYGYGNKREEHDALWPTHYDLGVKWVRISYWDSTLQWHFVEQERGRYVIDPVTDRCVTETVANGCNVVLCLAYGNWLYAPRPRANFKKGIWVIPYDPPPAPLNQSMREGYKRWVRFMVHHFKDRVRYFEIWNEPNCDYAWPQGPNPKQFAELVNEVAPIIRRAAPEAKIIPGSPGGGPDGDWFDKCFEAGLAPNVDVLAWHPFYATPPDSEAFRDYPERLARFKRKAQAAGFRGNSYMATEFTWVAPYPPTEQAVSEMVKAKVLARAVVMHLGLGVHAFWNETWNTQITHWDVGLLRNTFSQNPLHPVSCQPAYYLLRTLCTAMEGARPAQVHVQVRAREEIELYGFKQGARYALVALSLAGRSTDEGRRAMADLTFTRLKAKRVVAIDSLNGTEQELRSQVCNGGTAVIGVLVPDYPILVRAEW